MRNGLNFLPMLVAFALIAVGPLVANAQEWDQGELEDVEIEIVKERQITLPQATRRFEKIPPKPSEPIRPSIQYDFRPFSFQTSQINPAIRPLRLKQDAPSKVYGGQVSAGYGNYSTPFFEGFFNTGRDRNKLIGAHAWYRNSMTGPVDERNSGSGNSGLSVYAKSFSEHVSVFGDLGYDNRSTHFYGYPTGSLVEAADIRQGYNTFRISAGISNARNTAFAYKLGGAVHYLTDRYEARETEVSIDFSSSYDLSETSQVGINADYSLINRTDALVELKPRSLFSLNPTYVFYPVENLRMSAGIVAAFENDSIDDKNVHAYPDIRISYPLSPSVDVVGLLTGGMEKVSLRSLSLENMWLDANIPVFHTNKLYDLQLALHTRIGNKVSLNGGFSFASLKNWYFYRNTLADAARFTPEYDLGSTERLNFFASIGFVQAEAVKLLVRGDLYAYSPDAVTEAWHRPRYKLTGETSFNIYGKVLLGVNLIAQGGMEAVNPSTSEAIQLDAALDLNAKVEYVVSERFSVFVQANNILANEYPIFLNYPVRGFQILGGVRLKF